MLSKFQLPIVLLVFALAVSPFLSRAQSAATATKAPTPEAIAAAKKASTEVFGKLAAGKTEEVAAWISDEIGYTRDAASKITLKNDFKSKLDLIMTGPPVTPYGKISGYDLVSECYLPNSNRFFRLIYISYHEGAPLMWEFRYYVKQDGKIALNYVQWSEGNPFELIEKTK
jgi:hypothetical protein